MKKCNDCDRESRCSLFWNIDDERIEKEVCVIHLILSAVFHHVHKIWPDLTEEEAQYRANLITAEGFAISSKEAMIAVGIDPSLLEMAKGWVTDAEKIPGSVTNPFTKDKT